VSLCREITSDPCRNRHLQDYFTLDSFKLYLHSFHWYYEFNCLKIVSSTAPSQHSGSFRRYAHPQECHTSPIYILASFMALFPISYASGRDSGYRKESNTKVNLTDVNAFRDNIGIQRCRWEGCILKSRNGNGWILWERKLRLLGKQSK